MNEMPLKSLEKDIILAWKNLENHSQISKQTLLIALKFCLV